MSESLVTKFVNSLSFKLPSSLSCEWEGEGSGEGEGEGSSEWEGEGEGEGEGEDSGEGEGEDVILEREVEGSVTSSIVGNRATSWPKYPFVGLFMLLKTLLLREGTGYVLECC
ncbi:hypothetical protein Tco_0029238 [Tanacetum coccineum]